jgi:hypothetical protein
VLALARHDRPSRTLRGYSQTTIASQARASLNRAKSAGLALAEFNKRGKGDVSNSATWKFPRVFCKLKGVTRSKIERLRRVNSRVMFALWLCEENTRPQTRLAFVVG